MKSDVRLLILSALIFLFTLGACKKDKLDVNGYYECNSSQRYDSSAVTQKLVGSWIWSLKSCFGSDHTTTADKAVRVIFSGDATFIVTEEGAVVHTGTWQIEPSSGDQWELALSSPSQYLHGYILFCGDRVLFSASSRDGCDHLFNRIN